MILNCRRVALAYSEETLFLVYTPAKPAGFAGVLFPGRGRSENGIFHKNKIKRRTQ